MYQPPTLMLHPPMFLVQTYSLLIHLHTQLILPTVPYTSLLRTHPLLSPSSQKPLLPTLLKTHLNTSLLREGTRTESLCWQKNSERLPVQFLSYVSYTSIDIANICMHMYLLGIRIAHKTCLAPQSCSNL